MSNLFWFRNATAQSVLVPKEVLRYLPFESHTSSQPWTVSRPKSVASAHETEVAMARGLYLFLLVWLPQ